MKKIAAVIILLLAPFVNHFAQSPRNDLLPVTLVYFYGVQEDTCVALYWGTATEIQNYGFLIQRSLTATEWEDIGFVFGHGTTYAPHDYNFDDTTVVSPNIYYYRLKQVDTDGDFEYSGIISVSFVLTGIDDELNPPLNSVLLENYPNPFNSGTIIRYSLNEPANIELTVYDIAGRKHKTLLIKYEESGSHSFRLNSDELSSGVYFLILRSDKFAVTRKIQVIK